MKIIRIYDYLRPKSRWLVEKVPLTLLYNIFLFFFFYALAYRKDLIQLNDLSLISFGISFFAGMLTTSAISFVGEIIKVASLLGGILYNCFIAFLHILLGIYFIRIRVKFEYSVIADNFELLYHSQSFATIRDTFLAKDYIFMVALLFAFAAAEYLSNKFGDRYKLNAIIESSICFIVVLLHLLLIPITTGLLTDFSNSIFKYYTDVKITYDIQPGEYPYQKKFINDSSPFVNHHIFIILMESLNANFLERVTSSGKEITPYMNSLIKQGLYFEKFYGNSIQTAKGEVAVLCSLIPTSRGKIAVHFPQLNNHCLPSVMARHGYDTIWFQGFGDLSFDNASQFKSNIGFQHIHTAEQFMTSDEKENYIWGYGVQDNVMYSKFFHYLDSFYSASQNKKIFAILETISNHAKFNMVPWKQRYLFPDQNDPFQYYANSVHLADRYLQTFFEELEQRDYLRNSLVMIVGDHSFPVGEHGNFNSEVFAYDENFRTPFMILATHNSLPSQRNSLPYSQLDIAPTVLDLAGITTTTHFLGTSVFDRPPKAIFLIQPYGGVYLGVVKWPYKYIYHKKYSKHYLYNLVLDPHEEKNLADIADYKDILLSLQIELERIAFNDFLIKENRVWPNFKGE